MREMHAFLSLEKRARGSRTLHLTARQTLCSLCHSYFKGINANIELQVYSVPSC
jgi:hypothetical protein